MNPSVDADPLLQEGICDSSSAHRLLLESDGFTKSNSHLILYGVHGTQVSKQDSEFVK